MGSGNFPRLLQVSSLRIVIVKSVNLIFFSPRVLNVNVSVSNFKKFHIRSCVICKLISSPKIAQTFCFWCSTCGLQIGRKSNHFISCKERQRVFWYKMRIKFVLWLMENRLLSVVLWSWDLTYDWWQHNEHFRHILGIDDFFYFDNKRDVAEKTYRLIRKKNYCILFMALRAYPFYLVQPLKYNAFMYFLAWCLSFLLLGLMAHFSSKKYKI